MDIISSTLLSLFEPYQRRWVWDRSEMKLADKSRRIGFTFATAAEAVMMASICGGGMDVLYMAYKIETSKLFIRACAKYAIALNNALIASGRPPILGKLKDAIQTTKIAFLSGYEIRYVSHRAENLRGPQAYVVLDEYAFLPESEAALDAALAHRMLGGRIAVISTHNGIDNPFNRLIQMAHAGTFSCPISYHKVTLPQAVDEGFYKRKCRMEGLVWTKEGERSWVAKFLAEPRANQEYLCIPDALGSQYFPHVLMEEVVLPGKVARLQLSPEFETLSEDARNNHITNWYKSEVYPTLFEHYMFSSLYLGHDFARSDRGDVSSVCFMGEEQDLSFRVRLYAEMKGVPFRQQCKLFELVDRDVRNLRKYVVDTGANGRVMAEDMPRILGSSRVVPMDVNRSFYSECLPHLRSGMEERRVRIVSDSDIAQDFSSVIVEKGVPTLPRVKSTLGMGQRHCDSVVSTALAYSAARIPPPRIANSKTNSYGQARASRRLY